MCVYGVGVVANLVPLAGTEPADMLQNVVVFLPLGVLLPIVARVRSALRVLLCGLLLSLSMEAVQLLNAVTGHGGHVADVNDLLANAAGALLGYGVLRCALLVPPAAQVVRATTWPARTGPSRPPAQV